MIEVRRMQAEDLDAVAGIEKEIFSMPWSKKGFEDSLNAGNTTYLTALEDGRIIGYCGFLQVLDEAEITNVAVDETARCRGSGYRMMKKLLECAQEQGAVSVLLEVRESNAAAIGLYKKLGFTAESVRRNFYENPREDAIIMWKRWK